MPTLLIPKENTRHSLGNSVYLYWILLMAWQTLRTTSNRSIIDILIKVALIVFLSYSVLKIRLPNSLKNMFLLVIFAFYMVMLLFIKEPSISAESIIIYCFPILFSYLFLVHAYNYRLSINSYVRFLNSVIIAVLVMVGYTFIFDFNNLIKALSATSAYGNELTSFFISNHEYALYLFLGIQSCLFCYQFFIDTNRRKKGRYLLLTGLFLINLILTFSRTALLGVFVLVFVFLLTGKNAKTKKVLFLFSLLIIATLLFIPNLREFFIKIVLSDNDDAGRIEMWNYGLELFKNSTFFEKLTGQGFTKITDMLFIFSQHKNFHNSYIQVLLQYGIIGVSFLIGLILSSFVNGIRVFRKNRFIGAMFISMTLSTAAYIFTNTTIIMQSNIDSYILTIFVIILPIYVKNAIYSNKFV